MSGPKVYVATDFHRKEEALAVAKLLEPFGIELNARWLTNQPVILEEGLGGRLEGKNAEAAVKVAQEDLEDIKNASLFVQLTSGEKKRGGNHVELGYALAFSESSNYRPVIAVGPPEHAFHYHPGLVQLENTRELTIWVSGYMKGLA